MSSFNCNIPFFTLLKKLSPTFALKFLYLNYNTFLDKTKFSCTPHCLTCCIFYGQTTLNNLYGIDEEDLRVKSKNRTGIAGANKKEYNYILCIS